MSRLGCCLGNGGCRTWLMRGQGYGGKGPCRGNDCIEMDEGVLYYVRLVCQIKDGYNGASHASIHSYTFVKLQHPTCLSI